MNDEDDSATLCESGEDFLLSEEALRRHQVQSGICPDCGGQLRLIWSRNERPSWSDVLDSPSAPAWYQGNRL